jgi:hypothetical protein
MPNGAEWRLYQAQALLDVFEQHCGRPARTMAEVRNWIGAQNREHVQFKVKRRLLELLYDPSPQPNAPTSFQTPPRGWRVFGRSR